VQNEQPLGKLLSDTRKPEVKAEANADKLLGKPLSRAGKAEAMTKQKGDAPAADRLHNVEHKTLQKTQLVLPVPYSVYTKAPPYDIDVVDIGGKVCVCVCVCVRAGVFLPAHAFLSSPLLSSPLLSLSLSLSLPPSLLLSFPSSLALSNSLALSRGFPRSLTPTYAHAQTRAGDPLGPQTRR
jgi:hypothetical protein